MGCSETELEEACRQGFSLSTKEELFYYRIFQSHFPHPDAAKLIGKWQGTLH